MASSKKSSSKKSSSKKSTKNKGKVSGSIGGVKKTIKMGGSVSTKTAYKPKSSKPKTTTKKPPKKSVQPDTRENRAQNRSDINGDIHLSEGRGWIQDIIDYEKYGFKKPTREASYDIMKQYIGHALRSNMMIYQDRLKWTDHFNRMQYPNPYFVVGNTREYLFFTKPDLNIMRDSKDLNPALSNNSFWAEMRYKYRRVISDLQVSARRPKNKHDKHVFIPMLTNAVSSELDLPTISADITETPSTIYGTTMQYRKGSYKSDEGYDFSLDFIDSPWLDVYHFFKMWDEYETLKDLGAVGPKSSSNTSTGYYRINKILHDQIAIYKIIVDGSDMETILYYAKLTGVFPKSVPRDAFGSPKDDTPFTYSVDFHAQFVEDMKPIILYEFDLMCKKYLGDKDNKMSKSVPIYSNKYNEINGGFRRHPYVFAVSDSRRPTGARYVLKWFD